MSITMKGKNRDLLDFIFHLKIRNKKIRKASRKKMITPHINKISKELHPHHQELRIVEITDCAPGIKTFRLKKTNNKKPAYFRAGQYLVIEAEVNGIQVSRPYSLSCSPEESRLGSYYEITIKSEVDGFLSRESVSNWEVGKVLICSEPMGYFHFETLRDKKQLICFAGGSGITPFRSIIPELLEKDLVNKIVLFYGFNKIEEYLFKEDFKLLFEKYPHKFQIVPILSDPDSKWKGETGFITEKLIQKNSPNPEKSSWFICGPNAMKSALTVLADKFAMKRSLVRLENFSPERCHSKIIGKDVNITVHIQETTTTIKGSTEETIVYSLERAGLNPPAYCRSGECGWCRSKLISGKVDVPSSVSGIREADKIFGYIHTCCSYPIGDIEIKVSINPLQILKEE